MIVVAALIEKDNKYLIARRSTGTKDVLGKWEFPGGKVEENESDKQAIEREIKAGMFALIKKWLKNNCKESPEEMVEIINSEYEKKIIKWLFF